MASLSTSAQSPDAVAADVLVVAVGKSEFGPVLLPGSEDVDSALGGRLAAVLADLGASGDEGEVTRFASLGAVAAPVIVVVGLGTLEGAPTDEVVRKAAGNATRALAGRTTVAFALPGSADAVAEGALLAAYAVKAAPGKGPVENIVILGEGDAPRRPAIVAQSVNLARELVNLPPNLLFPAILADRAVSEVEGTGIEATVFTETELEAGGFGGILGVGQGLSQPSPARAARLGSGGCHEDGCAGG